MAYGRGEPGTPSYQALQKIACGNGGDVSSRKVIPGTSVSIHAEAIIRSHSARSELPGILPPQRQRD